jgi:DNA-binding IclR family transcriptional regulator
MLSEAEGDEVFQVRRDLMLVDDAYRTANGRLLLAYLSEAELVTFLRQKDVPGEVWPHANTEERLRQQLGAIRRIGSYIDTTPSGLARASFPIWQHGKVVAALGMYAPEFRFVGQRREQGLKRLEETAQEISQQLERRPTTETGSR